MPSPFPGMDPYLERYWGDVHAKLVTYASDDLNTRLPPDLIARVKERTAIESDSGDYGATSRRAVIPDARVFEAITENTLGMAEGGVVALAPYRLVLMDEPATEHFVEIIDTRGGERLITVLEFISPANKTGKGLKLFVSKREELLSGGVNFVEIDLVREGDWEQLFLPHAVPLMFAPSIAPSFECPPIRWRCGFSPHRFVSHCPRSMCRCGRRNSHAPFPCSR